MILSHPFNLLGVGTRRLSLQALLVQLSSSTTQNFVVVV